MKKREGHEQNANKRRISIHTHTLCRKDKNVQNKQNIMCIICYSSLIEPNFLSVPQYVTVPRSEIGFCPYLGMFPIPLPPKAKRVLKIMLPGAMPSLRLRTAVAR